MGDLRGAQDDARAAIEIWDGGLETYLPAAAYWYGLASLELGEPARAAAALALTRPLERWEGTGMAGFIHGLEGHLHLHHGRVAESVASHRACGEVMSSLMISSPAPMPWRSQAARGLLVLGHQDEAGRFAAEELRLAKAAGAPRPIGTARAALGLCTGGDRGLRQLARAAEELGACGAHLERTRTLLDLGAAMRRAGRPRDARAPLRAGLELAQRSEAIVLARRAETELRAAGGRGRRAVDRGPESLTASERRVAELAAEGHTNRHIAGLLQISIKAVEWHLHQSYRKLDIHRRTELPGVLGG
jgi:DNA-binding CsgD family transcriptional regulator